MTPQRKFYKNGVQHLYQITYDRALIFLTIPDVLLLYTLICIKSRLYNIRITGLCIMLNHFHIQASAYTLEDIERFMSAVTWTFAILFNHKYGISGPVFRHSYGSSPKSKPSKIFGNMIYIANNPVGKKAVLDAWNYRWNFLRYSPHYSVETGKMTYLPESKNPFSYEYNPDEASKNMLFLVKTINRRKSKWRAIDYTFFDLPQFKDLSDKERSQLTDIIISTYNVIDYSPMLHKYGSVEQYCRVLKEVEGNEYDLNDDWEPEDYRHYHNMIRIAREEGYDIRVMRYTGVNGASNIRRQEESQGPLMPESLANTLIKRFRNELGASDIEIGKFLKIKSARYNTTI